MKSRQPRMTSEGDKAEIITPINPVKQKEQQNHGGNSMASFHFPQRELKWRWRRVTL